MFEKKTNKETNKKWEKPSEAKGKKPPAAKIRDCSSGSSGLWSCVMCVYVRACKCEGCENEKQNPINGIVE